MEKKNKKKEGEDGNCCRHHHHHHPYESECVDQHPGVASFQRHSCFACGLENDIFTVNEPSMGHNAMYKALELIEGRTFKITTAAITMFMSLVLVVALPAASAEEDSSSSSSPGTWDAVITGVLVQCVQSPREILRTVAFIAIAFSGYGIYRVASAVDHRLPQSAMREKLLIGPLREATAKTKTTKTKNSPTASFESTRDGYNDGDALTSILSEAIQCQTVSYDDDDIHGRTPDYDEFLRLHRLLEDRFPAFHGSEHVTREVVAEYSLLYTWEGTDATLEPVMLCAHFDVVPAEGTELEHWEHPPFKGYVDDEGTIWGRGAIDNKHNVISQLYAADRLIASGEMEQPQRTIVFAMGHDEEIGGLRGASAIAKVLEKRGFHAEFILDEGAFIIRDMLPGFRQGVAMICNCEKGAVTYKMEANELDPGHSSAPPHESNISRLARAIDRLKSRPFPGHLSQVAPTFEYFSAAMPLLHRFVIRNMWLFGWILKYAMLAKHTSAPLARTTTAVTVVTAGDKFNKVPGSAMALVNHRILPPDLPESAKGKPGTSLHTLMHSTRPDEVRRYDRRIIGYNSKQITLNHAFRDEDGCVEWTPPSPVSSLTSRAWNLLRQATSDIHGSHVPVSHMVMTGNTDTRWYWHLAKDIYRHSSIFLERDELKMFHGYNERIGVKNLVNLARFYEHILRSVGGQSSSWNADDAAGEAEREGGGIDSTKKKMEKGKDKKAKKKKKSTRRSRSSSRRRRRKENV